MSRKSETSEKNNRKGWKIWSLAGLLLIVAAFLLVLYNNWESRMAGERSSEVLALLEEQIPEPETPDSETEENADSSGEEDAVSENREMPTIEIDGYRYIGYLECPSIHLKLPVMEEWDYTRLKTAPCRYSGSVYKNDLVIAGHNYARHFSPLRWQKIGTKINFIDAEGNLYPYEISDIEILNPTSVREMTEDSQDWDLTLFTCTIGGQTRYTIRCVRTDRKNYAEG